MHFDRHDICAAYARLESDYNVGGWLRGRPSNVRRREACAVQLSRMGYRMRDGLNCNARAIYRNARRRMGLVS